MSEMEATGKAKRGPVHRSPAYPVIDLKTALDRTRTFYQHEKRSAANVLVAAKHWGYSQQSSGGKQILAALIAFGLMEDKGSGDQRQVKLTDLALRVILDERPDSTERDAALRRAAQTPKIHAELFTKWPDALPSDINLRHHLLVEKKFNENSVDDFIKELRSTAEYANIYAVARVEVPASEADADKEVKPDGSENQQESPGRRPALPPLMPTPTGLNMRQDTFSLDEGLVVLQWPAQLSETSYEDLKDWMELQLRKIGRSVQSREI